MDLKVIETENGGDLVQAGNDLVSIQGLGNMIYLALFGGNVEQSTPTKRLANEQAFDWWGNNLFFPGDTSVQFNSETERTLKNVALNSAGRVTIEQAVNKDLEFMRPFANVTVEVTIPEHDKVSIYVKLIEPDNQEKEFKYIWDGTRIDLAA